MPFLDEPREWVRAYTAAGGRRGISVEFEEGPSDRLKRSAWIRATGQHAFGQMTLWETGECETEAAAENGTALLLRSRVLDEPTLVAVVADDLVDHLADYSGT